MTRHQIGLSFTADDVAYTRLTRAARRAKMRPTRVLRDLADRYLPLWEADRRAEHQRLVHRARMAAGRR